MKLPFSLVAALLAVMTLFSFAIPAQAQNTTCFTGTIFDGPYADGPRCFVNTTTYGTGGSGSRSLPVVDPAPVTVIPPVVVPPVDPVDPVNPVDPVDPPTEVPAIPLTPATPNPGVHVVNLTGTPFDGAVPNGPSTQTLPYEYVFNNAFGGGTTTLQPGTYDVVRAPNGYTRVVPTSNF